MGDKEKEGFVKVIQENQEIKKLKAEHKVAFKPIENPSKVSVAEMDVWRTVAKDINVRAATPREIITLSRQLFKAGAISYDDHIALSFQPEINLDSPSEHLPFSHQRRDYIALWQSKQENVLRFGGDREQIEETHRIQALLAFVDNLE